MLLRRVPVLLAVALGACGGSDPATSVPVGSVPPPAQASGSEVLLWAVGDGTASRDAARLVRTIAASRPQWLLYLGDVYEEGTAAEYRRNFDPTYGVLASRTWPTPGNHEWANRASGYEPYWRRKHGRAVPSYYALRAGDWQILGLNTMAPHGPRSAQVAWLRRQVRSGGTCRIAFSHHPRFSAGHHGDTDSVEPLWRALAGRARIALAGHDHGSQRLRPVDGITPYVAGAGGRDLYDVDEGDERLAFGDDRTIAALRIRLRGRTASLEFVSAGGRVLDRSRVTCEP